MRTYIYIISRINPRISQKQDTALPRRVSACRFSIPSKSSAVTARAMWTSSSPPKEGGRRVKKSKNLAAHVDKESIILMLSRDTLYYIIGRYVYLTARTLIIRIVFRLRPLRRKRLTLLLPCKTGHFKRGDILVLRNAAVALALIFRSVTVLL